MSEAPGYEELRKALADPSWTKRRWEWRDDQLAPLPKQWSIAPGVLIADGDSGTPGGDKIDRANAALMVAAKNAAPSLLSERDGLREALKEIEDKAALLALTHGHSGKLYEAFMALSIRASVALASAPNPPEAA